jgi:hypothetical protein
MRSLLSAGTDHSDMSLRVRQSHFSWHFGSKIELPDAEAVLDEFEKSLMATMRAKEAIGRYGSEPGQNSSGSRETFSRDFGARWRRVANRRIIRCAALLIVKESSSRALNAMIIAWLIIGVGRLVFGMVGTTRQNANLSIDGLKISKAINGCKEGLTYPTIPISNQDSKIT